MLPWRVKNFLSERFPLAYHLAVNLGAGGNDQVHWDQRLADTTREQQSASSTSPGKSNSFCTAASGDAALCSAAEAPVHADAA